MKAEDPRGEELSAVLWLAARLLGLDVPPGPAETAALGLFWLDWWERTDKVSRHEAPSGDGEKLPGDDAALRDPTISTAETADLEAATATAVQTLRAAGLGNLAYGFLLELAHANGIAEEENELMADLERTLTGASRVKGPYR